MQGHSLIESVERGRVCYEKLFLFTRMWTGKQGFKLFLKSVHVSLLNEFPLLRKGISFWIRRHEGHSFIAGATDVIYCDLWNH